MDMVRTGLLLYGLYPSKPSKLARKVELKNAMAFKAKIIQVKRIGAGEPVSYGNNYVTKKDTVVATIACGYADGYSRTLSGKTSVLISGEKVPLIGNICMDMCMADITGIENKVAIGEDAVLFDGDITAGDIAGLSDTINYEIICRIGMRVPRVYIKDGRIVQISNYLL
jgi:alanine racemase